MTQGAGRKIPPPRLRRTPSQRKAPPGGGKRFPGGRPPIPRFIKILARLVGSPVFYLEKLPGPAGKNHKFGLKLGTMECVTAFDYSHKLQKIFDIQRAVQDVHPILEKVFPVAIAEEGCFLIYDIPANGNAYGFVKRAVARMPVQPGVRAAFPLDCYDYRMACVVTGEVFDTLDGYVTIFHEFVHCQQFTTCEVEIKQRLSVARKAMASNDFMWELNHRFPYTTAEFTRAYGSFLASQAMLEVALLRKRLKNILAVEDYEYMVWQEWKEGFARFIENQIKQRLGLPENHGGNEPPFDRVVFYEGGANFIRILS